MSSEVKVRVSLSSGISTGLNKIKAQFSEFRRSLNSEFASLFAFGAITAGINQLISKGSQIEDLASRFGAPIAELQRVTNVGEQNGATMEDVARSWNKLTVNQAKAKSGNEEMRKSFAALGIDMKDVARLSVDELFYRVADATASAEDRGKAYAAVVALMGRNAGMLFTTLEQGSEAIKQQGDAIGVMSDKAVRSLDKIDDRLKILRQNLFVYGGGFLIFIQKIAESIGNLLGSVVNQWQGLFTGLGDAINKAVHGDFSGAGQALASTARGIKDEYKNLFADLKLTWNPADKPEGKRKPPIDEDLESTSKEKEAADKIVELREKLIDMQRKAGNEQLETEAKINAMIGQRAALLRDAGKESDPKKKLELEIDAQKIGDDIAKERASRDKEVDTAKERLAKAEQDREYASLHTDDQRKKFLDDQIDALTKLIAVETDASEKLDLQAKREGLLQKFADLDKKDSRPSVVADSLQRIGGGGRVAVSGSDPNLKEAKIHSQLLKDLIKAVKEKQNASLIMKP